MSAFLLFAAMCLAAAFLLFAVVSWIREHRPQWRNAAGFVVALVAAYAGSFALDLFIGASVGVYPFPALTIPVFTWTGTAAFAFVLARYAALSNRWVSLPFFLVGGLASMTGLLGRHRYSVLVGIPLITFALVSSAMGQQATGQTRKLRTRASFPIDKYKLDAPIDTSAGLTEFSATEYANYVRRFEGEKNYNALPVLFLGRPWKLTLGTVGGKIYKIAPYLELNDKREANLIAMKTLRYCTEKLGRPSSQETGMFTWDTTDGNVVLQTAETAEGLAINLFLTSKAVRTFRQRPR